MGKKGKKAVKKAAMAKEQKVANAATQKFELIRDKLSAVKHLGHRIRESSSMEEEWRLFIELVEHMEGVGRLQGAPEGGDLVDAGSVSLTEFEGWLQRKGVIGAGQAWNVRETEGNAEGRGIFASKDIDEGNVALRIPIGAMISTHRASESKAAPLLSKQFFSDLPTVALACMLLCELHQGVESDFHPLIATLPRRFTVPLCMRRADLDLLRLSPSQNAVVRSITATVNHYAWVAAELQELHARGVDAGIPVELTYHEFRWAMAVVMTRQNNLPVSVVGTFALIPAFDMINHEAGEPTSDFDKASEELILYAKRSFPTGNQVYMSYGPRPPSQLFVYQGFVPSPPDFEPVPLTVVLSRTTPSTRHASCCSPAWGSLHAAPCLWGARANQGQGRVKLTLHFFSCPPAAPNLAHTTMCSPLPTRC